MTFCHGSTLECLLGGDGSLEKKSPAFRRALSGSLVQSWSESYSAVITTLLEAGAADLRVPPGLCRRSGLRSRRRSPVDDLVLGLLGLVQGDVQGLQFLLLQRVPIRSWKVLFHRWQRRSEVLPAVGAGPGRLPGGLDQRTHQIGTGLGQGRLEGGWTDTGLEPGTG